MKAAATETLKVECWLDIQHTDSGRHYGFLSAEDSQGKDVFSGMIFNIKGMPELGKTVEIDCQEAGPWAVTVTAIIDQDSDQTGRFENQIRTRWHGEGVVDL